MSTKYIKVEKVLKIMLANSKCSKLIGLAVLVDQMIPLGRRKYLLLDIYFWSLPVALEWVKMTKKYSLVLLPTR